MGVTAVCPGSFDPITNGHVDVIRRTAARFDQVVVACGRNLGKQGMFDLEERLGLLEEAVGELPNVEIATFDGLLVEFCAQRGAGVVVKGIRDGADVSSELPMARMNAAIGSVETLLLPGGPLYSFVSSSLVKEVARFGGDVSDLVPPAVDHALRRRFA